MLKRILSFTCIFIITICLFIPIVNAESEFIVSPDNDEQPLYEILGSKDYNYPKAYTIYGYNAHSISKPTYLVPLVRTFFGDPSEMTSGTYEYDLYSTLNNTHRSYLQLNIYQGITYTLKYCVDNMVTNISASWFICSQINVNTDICLYAENDGVIYMVIYDVRTTELVNVDNYSNTQLKIYFYGDLYLYGQTPSAQDVQEAYNNGYQAGEEKGYEDGLRDGAPTESYIQNIYDNGYSAGEQYGYQNGFEDGTSADNKAVYEAGIAKGQEQAKLIPEAIDGFFDAILNFFNPFLSIGFGSLTLYSLLGIMIIVVVCVIIVKVTRG